MVAPARAVGVAAEPASTARPLGVALRRRLNAAAFVAPGVLGLAAFVAYPLLATLYYSFTKYNLITPPQWTGFTNYVYMFTEDPLFWVSAGNTLWLTVVITVGRVGFALATALVLTRIKRGSGFFRTVFYVPSLAPPVAATLAFVFLLHPGTGPVNQILGVFGIQGPLWFNDPVWAKPALSVMSLWTSGTIMIILLAALLDVPTELYEAAALDGAGSWKRFWNITLPVLSPVLLFAVVNSIIVGLQLFTEAVVAGSTASGNASVAGSSLTTGYPENSTLTYPIWLYDQAFQAFHLGYASAMAILLFIVSGVFTILLVRRMRSAGIGEEA